jgi:hypothetical protein
MRARHVTARLLVSVCLLAAAGAGAAEPRTTTITGKTYRWLRDADYTKLPHVRIHVFRDGNAVADADGKEVWESRADGSYRIVIRGGRPVQVVFYLSKDFVPEAQYLAARPGETLSISVGLVTVTDYQKLEAGNRGLPPLAARLRALESVLPSGSAVKKEVTAQRQEAEKAAGGRGLSLLVPAYFYPGGDTRKYWDTLIETAKSRAVPLVVIVNPSNGPGAEVDANYKAVIARSRAAGITLLGYVHTDYGKRPLSAVKKDVDRWKELYPLVHGLFVDMQASGADRVSYYADLYQHARKALGAGLVVSNPGTLCAREYVTRPTTDAVCVYEDRTARRAADIKLPPWAASREARLVVLIYDLPGAAAMSLIKDLGPTKVRYVYCTDAYRRNGRANPWARLPTYWARQVEAVQSVNQARERKK